jgi:hypothetical protein
MAKLLKVEEFKEGDIFCRWLYSRLINQNKNVLGVELGSTGSGKSYRDLRKAELWYKFHFKQPFPTENICFGTLAAMERITSGKMRKGEVIIFEEAGANLGNLDFQSKVSKMFTYVLQSFRSMNIAIFFNLPYFSMLNKSARMLMHYSFESAGINMEEGLNNCRPFFHQVNQKTGKVYQKFPKVRQGGGIRKVKVFSFERPSQYLLEAYEQKKKDYLAGSTELYKAKMREIELKDTPVSIKQKALEPHLLRVWKLNQEGKTQSEIGKIEGKNQKTISCLLKTIEKRGHKVLYGGKTRDRQYTVPLLTIST